MAYLLRHEWRQSGRADHPPRQRQRQRPEDRRHDSAPALSRGPMVGALAAITCLMVATGPSKTGRLRAALPARKRSAPGRCLARSPAQTDSRKLLPEKNPSRRKPLPASGRSLFHGRCFTLNGATHGCRIPRSFAETWLKLCPRTKQKQRVGHSRAEIDATGSNSTAQADFVAVPVIGRLLQTAMGGFPRRFKNEVLPPSRVDGPRYLYLNTVDGGQPPY